MNEQAPTYDTFVKELFLADPQAMASFILQRSDLELVSCIPTEMREIKRGIDCLARFRLLADQGMPLLFHLEGYLREERSVDGTVLTYHSLLLSDPDLIPGTEVVSVAIFMTPTGCTAPRSYRRVWGKKGLNRLTFEYKGIRLWEISVRKILRLGLPLAALAPFCAGARPEHALRVADEIRQLDDDPQLRPKMAELLLLAVALMMKEAIEEVSRRLEMDLSDVPAGRRLLQRGIDSMQRSVLSVMAWKLGDIPDPLVLKVKSIGELEELERILDQALNCGSAREMEVLLAQHPGSDSFAH